MQKLYQFNYSIKNSKARLLNANQVQNNFLSIIIDRTQHYVTPKGHFLQCIKLSKIKRALRSIKQNH